MPGRAMARGKEGLWCCRGKEKGLEVQGLGEIFMSPPQEFGTWPGPKALKFGRRATRLWACGITALRALHIRKVRTLE